jgi:threonine dehydrogenase-like Zn-dependent dehydrogenase
MMPQEFTRRSFMKIPGSAAAIVGAPAILPAQSPNGTLRVGVIGIGTRGHYLLTLAVKSPGVQVVAVCDNHPETLKRAEGIVERGGPARVKHFETPGIRIY